MCPYVETHVTPMASAGILQDCGLKVKGFKTQECAHR